MKEYNLSELRNSQLIYDKNPPTILYVILIATLIVLGSVIFYASQETKEDVLHIQGTVDYREVTYISTTMSGPISSLMIQDGTFVQKGDVVLTIDNPTISEQLDAYSDLANYYLGLINENVLLKDAVQKYDENKQTNSNTSNKNPFNERTDGLLYYKYNNFLKEVQDVEKQYETEIKSRDDALNNAKQEALDEALEIARQKSIDDGTEFDEDAFKRNFELNGFDSEGFLQQYEEKHGEIEPLPEQRKAIILQYVYNAESNIQNYEPSYKQYAHNRDLAKMQLDQCSVKASRSGYLYYQNPLYEGLYVTEQTNIAMILQNNDEPITIKISLPAAYRSYIDTDTKIRCSILGYSESRYGTLDGCVESISLSTYVVNETPCYQVVIKLSNDNEKISIKEGMIAECSIIYAEKSWLGWALEQMGLGE